MIEWCAGVCRILRGYHSRYIHVPLATAASCSLSMLRAPPRRAAQDTADPGTHL